MEDDTIVAVATPPGRGALGIVRVSGHSTLSVLEKLFPNNAEWVDRRATVATAQSASGLGIDETIVTVFRGPRSYTGEDMAEISCHGSPLILDRLVEAALAAGARAARPGEFTLRAFLNGRLDLAQAEAVVDLVEARTDAGLELARRQLEGELSKRVEPLRTQLVELLAHMTALVDFSEEDIPSIAEREVSHTLETVGVDLDRILAGSHQGQVLSHGVSLAIVGAPNAGKSSILNGLLGRDRAIVTPIAGTTRDTLEEELSLAGVLFRIVDTAGMSRSADPVEALGVERSRAAIGAADIVLVVVDRSRELNDDDRQVFDIIQREAGDRTVAVVLNKSDLPVRLTEWPPMAYQDTLVTGGGGDDAGEPVNRRGVGKRPRGSSSLERAVNDAAAESVLDVARDSPGINSAGPAAWPAVETSAVMPNGLNALRALLPQVALAGPVPDGFVVSNVRHIQSLQVAAETVRQAISGQREGVPMDLISLDVRVAVESLGSIMGIDIGDEVLDLVFSRFCIGK
ncbi:MAG TPA: tRNA uridine-5-carboxymethylaminomethyl(34) synthesis GTPase MnmE [Chloroflexota bacterium]|jgi:tRNA modification GTPase|nr:tRNA uridine-5-carboxymethylaminomethyl(34) synthesis GTPase MnmE [Chloroflexota bacterium]